MLVCGHEVKRGRRLVFFAGPCAIESLDHALYVADKIATIAQRTEHLFVYKSSFDKANRTSASSYRGVGLHEGLDILQRVKDTIGLPVITDVHEKEQILPVSQVADVLQTPAFLCRQTDFIQAVAASGLPVNLKKGQFLSPADMVKVGEKAEAAGGTGTIMLCERGTTFGYGNLVVDMRGIDIMRDAGFPVIMDATHSVQLPGAAGTSSGGERRFVPTLARAAVAAGADGVFMEVHEDPDRAPCDGPNAWPIQKLSALVDELITLRDIANSRD